MPQSKGNAGTAPDKAMFFSWTENGAGDEWRASADPQTPWQPAGSHAAVTHTGTTKALSAVPELGLHVYVRTAKPRSAAMDVCNMKDVGSHRAPSIPGGAAGEWIIHSAHKTPHRYVMHTQPCTKHKSIEVHNVIWTEIEWSHKKGAQHNEILCPPQFCCFPAWMC